MCLNQVKFVEPSRSVHFRILATLVERARINKHYFLSCIYEGLLFNFYEMSLISLHKKYSFIDYQNQLCSFAALVTFLVILVSVFLPIVWIINVNTLSADFTQHEQPRVKFQYKYIFNAEHNFEIGKNIVLCSSFSSLIEHQNGIEDCNQVKIIEKDLNFDGMVDEIHFTFVFNSKYNYGVKSSSIVLFLDARIDEQCKFRIPAAVVIKNKHFMNNVNDREIIITGSLQPKQIQPLQCPFFMRNVKSHFFFGNINENETRFEDFKFEKIEENLERNPMHFRFVEESTDYGSLKKDETSLKIKLSIPQVSVRYNKTFWQKMNDIWINYIAVCILTFFLAKIILGYLFENRHLMALRRSPKNKNE